MQSEIKPVRPIDGKDLLIQLQLGKVCEIPTKSVMQTLLWIGGIESNMRLEVETNGEWTKISPPK